MALEPAERNRIRLFLEERFDLGELRNLAFALGINHQLFHETLQDLPRELVAYLERRDRLSCLIIELMKQRPNNDLAQLLTKLPPCQPTQKIQMIVPQERLEDISGLVGELTTRSGMAVEDFEIVGIASGSIRLLISLPEKLAGPQVFSRLRLDAEKYQDVSIVLFDSLDPEEQEAWRLIACEHPPIRQGDVIRPTYSWQTSLQAVRNSRPSRSISSERRQTFFRLSDRLQHGIANILGLSSLRPVQEVSIEAVLAGDNCIVLAPTAGGKTEAAFFPILDIIYRERLSPVSTLYISPIRALLNNQEPRLSQLAGLVGASVFKWHGDVEQAARNHFLAEPSQILMTTPESLEVMLISPKIDKTLLFAGLRFVVIDEIHNFASGDRGAHLMAVLERLARYTSFDIQRIGLSATVGDPEAIGQWMQGSSRRPITVINPPGDPVSRLIRIDVYNDSDELARRVAPLAQGRKTLFFVEGRRFAEGVKQALSDVTAVSHVHHSSVGRELREEAEQSFTYGSASQCIVCTSTLELGLDVGDLDAVLQLDAPATVSSFMQRMGRTGRRPGSQAEMDFFCGDEMALLRAVALVNLARRHWIESIRPTEHAVHVLAHQTLAQALQFYGVRRDQVWEVAQRARPFSKITRAEFDHLLDHLVKTDILNGVDGLLVLGKEGENRYGGQNFLALYSVFETPEEVRVVTTDNRVIGTLQTWFVQQVGEGEGFIFVLAGRAWQVQHLDLQVGEMTVIPAPRGAIPRWGGGGALISREIAEEMRAVLLADEDYPILTTRARERLKAMRLQWRELLLSARLPIRQEGQEWTLFTFAGDRINILLGRALALTLNCDVSGDSFSVKIKSPVQKSLQKDDIWQALETIRKEGFFSMERIMAMVSALPHGRLSKFQDLLPPDLEARFLAERLFDVGGLLHWLTGVNQAG